MCTAFALSFGLHELGQVLVSILYFDPGLMKEIYLGDEIGSIEVGILQDVRGDQIDQFDLDAVLCRTSRLARHLWRAKLDSEYSLSVYYFWIIYLFSECLPEFPAIRALFILICSPCCI